jgi:hypothetical protein
MITLTTIEKDIIKLCKGYYRDLYPYTGKWSNTLMPLFKKYYGWNPEDDYNEYLNVLFSKLLDIHLKIANDKSGFNHLLKGVFSAAFYKSIVRDEVLPIERSISELCGLIQGNPVREEDGTKRYNLE